MIRGDTVLSDPMALADIRETDLGYKARQRRPGRRRALVPG